MFARKLHRNWLFCHVANSLSFANKVPLWAKDSERIMWSKYILKLILFHYSGLDNAGKTTILKRLNGEDIDTIEPTLGFNINTLEHRGYTLNFWDVGGQKSLRSYWRNYFESTDGLVWVVDSADKMRLANCKEELNNLLQEERLAGATLLVLANKQDAPGALSSKDIKDVCFHFDATYSKQVHILDEFIALIAMLISFDWFLVDFGARQDWNASLVGCGSQRCDWWKTVGINRLADRRYSKANIHARLDGTCSLAILGF